jgi:hypothetical protein
VEVTDFDHMVLPFSMQIQARYEYDIVIEEDCFPSCLTFTVELGLAAIRRPALHFALLGGSEFLMRVVMGGIRRGCFP